MNITPESIREMERTMPRKITVGMKLRKAGRKASKVGRALHKAGTSNSSKRLKKR